MIVDGYKIVTEVLAAQGNVQKQISQYLLKCLGIKIDDTKLQSIIEKHKAVIVSVSSSSKGVPTLLNEEQDILAKLVAEGNEDAKEVIYIAFKPYLNAMVYRYTHEMDMDALSEANVALMRAIQAYNNSDKKGHLNGYVTNMLRAQLSVYLTQKTCGGTEATPYVIRVTAPVNKWLVQNTDFVMSGLISDDDIKDCSEDLGLDIKTVKKRIDQILMFNIKYLDDDSNSSSNVLLIERLPGDQKNPLDVVINKEENDMAKICESFSKLEKKDRRIITDHIAAKKEDSLEEEFAKYGNGSKATYYRRLNKAKAAFSAILMTAGLSTHLLEYLIK